MKDRTVATIQYLTDLLAAKTELAEGLAEQLDFERDESGYLRSDKERYRLEAEELTKANEELAASLRARSETYLVPNVHENQYLLLLNLFTRDALVFLALRNYMNEEADRTNKIKMIARVREITGWGLKESKDFVESYPFPPVAEKPVPSPEYKSFVGD